MTPETTAIVRLLENISRFSRAECAASAGLVTVTAAQAAKGLSQERTCSTCRRNAEHGVCQIKSAMLVTMRGPVAGYWDNSPDAEMSCTVWEPKEGG
jgi:hypothetical protein